MESSQLCRLFVGGLHEHTRAWGLRSHFQAFGTLTDCMVVVNPQTKRSRCFGFVTYSNVEEADAAMAASPHVVEGNRVGLKRAVSREDSALPGALARVKKLFMGGLTEHVAEGALVEHFSQFGLVEKAEIIVHRQAGRTRGFGFVYFQSHNAADKAAVIKFHHIQGQLVEVKKAVPEDDVHPGGGDGGDRDPNVLTEDSESYSGYSGGGGYHAYGGGGGESSGGSDYGHSFGGFGGYMQHQSSYRPMKGGGGGGYHAYGGGSASYGGRDYGHGFGGFGGYRRHKSSYGPMKGGGIGGGGRGRGGRGSSSWGGRRNPGP